MHTNTVTDQDIDTIFGSNAAAVLEAGASTEQVESVYDPAMAPAATSWPCVAIATLSSSC